MTLEEARTLLYKLNPVHGTRFPSGEFVRVIDTVDKYGWEATENIYPEIKRLLQVLMEEL